MTDFEIPFSKKHRARLQPILETLDASGQSVFLDLCELTMMLAERVDGTIKFEHARVTVHIKKKKK
jgi:hypothetical protein